MKLKKNNAPNLPVCPMHCDAELHPKLNDYDLTKFMNCHSTNLLLGVPGSGKTNLMYSFLKSKKLLNKVYDKIYLFQPSASRMSMKDKLFDQLPEDQKFETLDFESLESVKDRLNEEENSCIIFDDMGSYLKDHSIKKLLKEIIMNRRHLYVSVFFLAQTYFSVDKEIRRLFSNVFIFKVAKDTMASIFEELITGKKNKSDEIVSMVYDKKYNYLFLNVDSGRMFKQFDEIID